MSASSESLRQEQLRSARTLREQHKTWVEAADLFRARYAVNARVALRLVRGWRQRQAADEWNAHWPADPTTFKNFSYWEVWPAKSGHSPSLNVLSRLAALYECRVADLLADCDDFRHRDVEFQARAELARLPGVVTRDTADAVGSSRINDSDGHQADSETTQHDTLAALVEKVEEMSAEELASTVAAWAGQLDSGISRRGLLLKLSAGISLAAADPALALADGRSPSAGRPRRKDAADLEGIWYSRYVYYNSRLEKETEGEHYIVLRQQADCLIGQGLPHSMESKLRLDLSVEGSIATGTWMEQTSPSGYYKGATYHGTLQLIVNPMGRAMSGRWLGFGRNFKVNSGEWELTWVDGSTSQRTLRQYHLKA